MTENQIFKLSDETINQIAAGEVIERPSGVIRELIENSIDAGARHIKVKINFDNLTFFIKDDGVGIPDDQILNAFERHTTSKLKDFSELESIATLGFRGEALASIASISRVTLSSSHRSDGVGRKVVLVGGQCEENQPISQSRGTEILIEDLFYNTPVRKKFFSQSTSSDEFQLKNLERKKIKEEVINQIISSENIHFTYETVYRSREVREFTIPEHFTLKDKILNFFKTSDLQYPLEATLLEVKQTVMNHQVTGYITNLHCRERRNDKQYLMVHNRVIRDPYFIKAVQTAYLHKIPHGTHPICFLRVAFPEQEVDFNIHPRKEQVKFRDSNQFFKVVQQAIKLTLNRNLFSSDSSGASDASTSLSSSTHLNQNSKQSEFPHTNLSSKWSVSDINQLQFKPVFKEESVPPNELENNSQFTHESIATEEKRVDQVRPTILGQVAKCFILFSIEEDLYITDQHAAHERINFDVINRHLGKEEDQQILLIPLLFDKSTLELDRILEQQESLANFGFEVERFGDQTLRVSKVPAYLPENKIKLVVSDLLDHANDHQVRSPEEFLGNMTARMACRMSVMAGDLLSRTEMERLVMEIYEKGYVHTCPHGRPFVKKISKKELNHFFDRGRHIL